MPIIKKYTYTSGTATFNDIIEPSLTTGQMIKNRNYVKDGDKISYVIPLINAIDISWNNAYLSNIGTYINNSADLLNIIDNLGLSSEALEEIRRAIEERMPANLSDLVNDTGYITKDDIPSYVSEFINDAEYVTKDEVSSYSVTYISELINDAGYITSSVLNTILKPYVTEDEILENENLHGKSAYQIAWDTAIKNMEAWPYKNESEWLESLRGLDGAPGANGKSAYQAAWEAARDKGEDFPYVNEKEWASALNNVLDLNDTIEEIQQTITEKQDKLTAGEGIDITNNVISSTLGEWLWIE